MQSQITLPRSAKNAFYNVCVTVKPDFVPLFNKVLKRYRRCPLDLLDGFDGNPHMAKYVEMMYEEDYKWYGTLTTDELPLDEGRMLIRSLFINPSTDAIDLMCKYPHIIEWDQWLSGLHQYVCLNQSPIIATLIDNHLDKVDWDVLSSNPAAANFLTNHVDKINWYNLSANPSDYALDLLESYPENINYYQLSSNTNPRAIEILKKNIGKIDWVALSSNPSGLPILREHPEEIFWGELASNTNPEAIRMIEENLYHLDWDSIYVGLGENPAAVSILRRNIEWVNWSVFCEKANTPESIQFIRENIHCVNWNALSTNKYALSILKEFPDNICFTAVESHDMLDYNYTYDYKAILDAKHDIHQEYHAWAGHPSRMYKWKDWGMWEDVLDEEDDEEN
jgi:hypothetical protein